MKAQPKTANARRPKMEPTAMLQLDEARRRVIASQRPSLSELRSRLGGWQVTEVVGKVTR